LVHEIQSSFFRLTLICLSLARTSGNQQIQLAILNPVWPWQRQHLTVPEVKVSLFCSSTTGQISDGSTTAPPIAKIPAPGEP
jgi:hypothetical protein